MQRISGKLIGLFIGFTLGGPFGALVGFVLGMLRDNQIAAWRSTKKRKSGASFSKSDSLQQSTFLIGVIVLSAKLAKVDGRVKREEINAFRRVFHIKEEDVDQVGDLYNQARTTASGYEPYAARMAQVFATHRGVLESVLVGLCQIAVADSPKLTHAEDVFLRRIAQIFGFSAEDYARLAARAGITLSDQPARPAVPPLDESYAVLGLKETATASEIKAAYRALIRKHHPDRLASQGLSPDQMKQATERMKKLNVAYDKICKMRGIK